MHIGSMKTMYRQRYYIKDILILFVRYIHIVVRFLNNQRMITIYLYLKIIYEKNLFMKNLSILLFFGLFSVSDLFAQINTNSPAVPFGSHTSYSYGIMPTNLPSSGTYGTSQDAATAYTEWKSNYIEVCTVGSRVKFTGTNSAWTVSEGIAYGMLLSAYAGDKPLFDNLWKYYRNNTNGQGVMNWEINGCTGAVGANGATDAELDAAMALIVASKQWSTASSPYTYKTEALYLIGKIKQYEIDSSTFQTINGDMWGMTSTCRNPSYLSPAYYKEYAIIDAANATFWNNCVAACNTVLTGNRNATTGLISNWCGNISPYSDNSCGNTGSGSSGYGADACRNPWRMATDYLWHGSAAATVSIDISSKLAAWITGYESQLKGPLAQNASNPSAGSYKNGSYSAFGLAPMTVSTKQTSLNSCYTNVVGLGTDASYYFNSTIRCLTLFVMTGNFWAPSTSNVISPPLFSSATTNSTGTTITVTFDKAMAITTEYSKFTLLKNGTAISNAFTAITANGTNSYDLTLTTSAVPGAGDVLTLSYTLGTIKSSDGAILAAFMSNPVTNALAGNSTLVDDGEDGNGINNLGGKWFTYNDNNVGGKSTVTPTTSATTLFTMTAGGANSSTMAAKISYKLSVGTLSYSPFVGIGTYTTSDSSKTSDWSKGTGISFYYKGAVCTLQVVTPEVTDAGYYSYIIPASTASYTKVTVNWSSFSQPIWAKVVTFNKTAINKIQWQTQSTTGSTGDIWLDDIKVEGLVPSTPVYTQQNIILKAGWNLISFFVQPPDSSIKNVFASIGTNLIAVKTQDGFYDPNQLAIYNSLTKLEKGKAYWVNVKTAQTLSVSGLPIGTLNLPLKAGWNLVGYPKQTNNAVNTVLSGIWSQFSFMKNLDGFYQNGGTLNSLTNFVSGMGYFIKVSSACTLTY
jgi:hypothetical protein